MQRRRGKETWVSTSNFALLLRGQEMAQGGNMLATVSFWVCLILVVSLGAWLVLRRLLEKYGQSEFVRNEHNGVIVVALRDDFLEEKRNTKPGEMVKTKNAFVFWDKYGDTWADKSLMLGDSSEMYDILGNLNDESEPSLFVPHVSSRQMTIEEQKKFFQFFTPEEARKYLRDHKPAFFVGMWRKLTAWYWYGGNRGFNVSLILGFLVFISLLVWLVAANSAIQKEKRWEFTTNTSAVDPTPVAYKERHPIAAIDSISDNSLFGYTITKDPIYIGGNLVSVEGTYNDDGSESAVRASFTLGLKKGDVVIVRIGQVKSKEYAYIYEAWVITEAEAQALIASGKFRLFK